MANRFWTALKKAVWPFEPKKEKKEPQKEDKKSNIVAVSSCGIYSISCAKCGREFKSWYPDLYHVSKARRCGRCGLLSWYFGEIIVTTDSDDKPNYSEAVAIIRKRYNERNR